MFRPISLSVETHRRPRLRGGHPPHRRTHSISGALTPAEPPPPSPSRSACMSKKTHTARCIGPGWRTDSALRRISTVVAHPSHEFSWIFWEISSLLRSFLFLFFRFCCPRGVGAPNPAHRGPSLSIADIVALDGLAAVVRDLASLMHDAF